MFFRAFLLETSVLSVEGEPAFRWTDFLVGTEVDAAGSDGVRFIFLIVFRFIVVCFFGGYFVQKLNGFNQSSPWPFDWFYDKVSPGPGCPRTS